MNELSALRRRHHEFGIAIILWLTGALWSAANATTLDQLESIHTTAARPSRAAIALNTKPRPRNNVPSTITNRITNIVFRRGAEDTGRIEITLSGGDARMDITKHDGRIIAILPNTRIPADLKKRLDVMVFATPVKYVDIAAQGAETRIVVTPIKGAVFESMAYQTGNQFILALKPVTQTRVEKNRAKDEPQFTGEKISLSFQKIDIRAVLQIIADVADINLVVSNNVSGQVTLRLENIPWDQALHIVLQSQGLGMRRVANVINIAPLVQITQRERAELNAYQATRNLAPLQSEIIQINYAKAANIAALIQSGSEKTAMLSKRGRVTVDKRTNSLLITDTAARINNIRRVIKRFDVPVRQVLIEARIVVANRGFSRELGVTQSVNDSSAITLPNINGTYSTGAGYTINLPVANAAGTIATSIIGNSFNLNLALSAMESENRGQIMSAPRVITTDGQQAIIEQGQKVPYTTQQGNDAPATTEFKEVVLNLTVTPHITPDEHVLLELNLTQDSVRGFATTGEPIIDTRSLQTQVLVSNGNTVVLGGIYQQRNSNSESQVPFLGDVPIVGVLFSKTKRQHSKRELLLFITPRILPQTLTAR